MQGPLLSPCLAATLGQICYQHRNRPAFSFEFLAPYAVVHTEDRPYADPARCGLERGDML